MANPQKRKGSKFERDAVKILESLIEDSTWKRIPGSGAIGTSLGEPLLTGDIIGKVKRLSTPFKVEAKVGYGGKKQFGLKKEWLDKIKEEASQTYGFPFLIGKFSGATSGIKVFVVMDVEEFSSLINHITSLQEELESRE
jgi:Holliday junction resolvase